MPKPPPPGYVLSPTAQANLDFYWLLAETDPHFITLTTRLIESFTEPGFRFIAEELGHNLIVMKATFDGYTIVITSFQALPLALCA